MEELTNAINLKNTHPVTDEVGETLKPFRFKLTNTCGVGVDYNVNLEIMETESRIASKNIATKVNENTKSILSNNPTAPITYNESDYTAVEAYTIHSASIEPYGSVEHDIRIWLDESAGNDSQNGTFYSKVVIDGRQNQKVAVAFNEYIINQVEDNPSIEEFEHVATNQTVALTDYRYVGKNPNNYVCFGSEEETCPEDNLYRIIGVIPTQSEVDGEYENRVKLIKEYAYSEVLSGLRKANSILQGGYGYTYNNTNSSVWQTAQVNLKVLNGAYWNSLEKYQNYIALSLWYLGSNYGYGNTSEQWYSVERNDFQITSDHSVSSIFYIGLMYPSDYALSMGVDYKDSILDYATNQESICRGNTWLYNGSEDEFTINAKNFKSSSDIYAITSIYKGGISGNVVVSEIGSIRPTFYLKSNILYKSGSGTVENPYRISINE